MPLNGPSVVGEGSLRVGAGVGLALELGEAELVVELEEEELEAEELVEVSVWGAANATDSKAKREIHWSGNMVSQYCMA